MVTDLDNYESSDLAVVFGTYKRHVPISYRRGHAVHQQLNKGLNAVILETGYINRGSGKDNHYAAGLNGLNGRAKFNNADSPADRFAKLKVDIKPWRTKGSHILICGQVPWDASVDHLNFIQWANETTGYLQAVSDRPIVYRPHPLAFTPTPEGCRVSTNKTLAEDLEDCWAVVTCNSNSAVEAAIAMSFKLLDSKLGRKPGDGGFLADVERNGDVKFYGIDLKKLSNFKNLEKKWQC